MTRKKKVLGVDPGTQIMGYGVYDGEMKLCGQLVADNIPEPLRIFQLFRELDSLMKTHRPTHVAIENSFAGKDPSVNKKLGHAQGVAIILAVAYNAEVLWFYPVQVKKALTGSGKATKEEMQAAAERVGGFTKGLTADEADGGA